VLGTAIVALGCERETRDTDIKVISIGETKALWDRSQRESGELVIFLDPRPTKEFAVEHIPTARNLQLPQAPMKGERDPRIERYSNIVVYGNNPGSATARGLVKRLLALGYKGIRFFAGGLEEWNGRGYPVDGTGRPTAAENEPKNGEAKEPVTPVDKTVGNEPPE
jgi:rhodanese-related sulfurtransferase